MKEKIDAYLAVLASRGRTARTTETYAGPLRRLLAFLQRCGIDRWAAVTEAHLEAFLAEVRERLDGTGQVNPRSLWRIACAVRSFYAWLVEEGVTLSNPAERLARGLRLPVEILPAVPSEEAIGRLLAEMEGAGPATPLSLRDRAIVEVLYGAGLRRGELVGLELPDVDLEQMTLVVRRGKGGKERRAPLAKGAAAALSRYLAEGRPALDAGFSRAVFLAWHGLPLTSGGVEPIFKRLRELAAGHGIYPHLLRHAYATHLYRGGMDIRKVQVLLGHESIDTTVRYTEIADEDLRDAIRKKHPRSDQKQDEKE